MKALQWIVRLPLGLVGLLLSAWSVLSVYYSGLPWSWLRTLLAGLVGLAILVAWIRSRTFLIGAAWTLGIFAACLTAFALTPPSNSREWVAELSRTPSATFDGDRVVVRDVRNFEYRSGDDFIPRWEDRSYDLNELRSLDLVVSYWDYEAIAHTMLSFGFANGEHLALSVEIRREVGEEYSEIEGSFQRFEILYVLADERDVIQVRTNHRGEDVFVFRTVAEPERVRDLFVEVLKNANELSTEPRWYRTLGSNCTTNLVDLANAVAPQPIPYTRKILLNGYFPQQGFEQGWLVSDLPFEEYKRSCFVSDLALEFGDAPGYSQAIRTRTQLE